VARRHPRPDDRGGHARVRARADEAAAQAIELGARAVREVTRSHRHRARTSPGLAGGSRVARSVPSGDGGAGALPARRKRYPGSPATAGRAARGVRVRRPALAPGGAGRAGCDAALRCGPREADAGAWPCDATTPARADAFPEISTSPSTVTGEVHGHRGFKPLSNFAVAWRRRTSARQ